MRKLILRKIRSSDVKYFYKWWRDRDLLKLTSGQLKLISDSEVEEYFSAMLRSKNDLHYLILLGKKAIGHISLSKRRNNWHETQVIIGENQYWGKGYGTNAIRSLMKRAKRLKISKIFLEVRPNNTRAIKSYEKCGFQRAGIKRYPKNKYLPETLKMVLRFSGN